MVWTKKEARGSWSEAMKRCVFWLGVVMAVLLVGSRQGLTWGDQAHTLTVKKAIDALPKPLKGFYEKRESAITQNVEDATIGSPRSVFEVDSLESFPFEDLPLSRTSAVEKYGEEKVAAAGDLPWKLIEDYEGLVQAFQENDLEKIDTISARIVMYVDDLSEPLNVSKLGDGAITGQEGFRDRFDGRLLETYGDKLKVDGSAAIYLDRPDDYIRSILVRSYVWVDNLLLIDYLSHLGVSSYDRFYYEGLWLRSEDILDERLSDAARDTASYWYTAWTKAGKPELPD
jgi:hypothetical protein